MNHVNRRSIRLGLKKPEGPIQGTLDIQNKLYKLLLDKRGVFIHKNKHLTETRQ